MSDRRLIEVAFPLRETSLDAVHEKNVRHGHISTLHIWPARRPLAACRAALIATLLDDPGNDKQRHELLKRMAGELVNEEQKDGTTKLKTKGGILRWGRESGPDLQWFRDAIRKKYGRAPRVLDPFAGGGAIPLEAMRLGCEAVAADINPVAWFLLKCTLEYPQRLAGQTRPLPAFAWADEGFRAEWKKAHPAAKAPKGVKKQAGAGPAQTKLVGDGAIPEADLAWHVRAWGRWVHARAAETLAAYYPVYLEQRRGGRIIGEPEVVPPGVDADRLAQERNDAGSDADGWHVCRAVAYLWARTAPCKRCGIAVPLLKTRWLSRREGYAAVLKLSVADDPGASGGKRVIFGVQELAKRTDDAGSGTMSRAGVACPACNATMTIDDIRLRGKAGEIGTVVTAVVVEGPKGKEYRPARHEEVSAVRAAEFDVDAVYERVPFGLPTEPTPKGGNGASRAFSVDGYGLDQWHKLYTRRQLVALGTFVTVTRTARTAMLDHGYSPEWAEALSSYLAIVLDRTANYMSTVCIWESAAEEIKQTFLRFALPITWDFAEANPLCDADRFYVGAISNVFGSLSNLLIAGTGSPPPTIMNQSAIRGGGEPVDVIVTDPPYYDAIPYSDLMDFFYLWLRRTTSGWSDEFDAAFAGSTAPKWSHAEEDGELIDDSSRHGNSAAKSRQAYEDGMFRAFQACTRLLAPDGRIVVVFANKQPAAWAALAAALIRAGCVVTGSWPIATEMTGGIRNHGRASLSSSVWLVCRKRPVTARAGFDRIVLDDMRANIGEALRRFWDDGIRGPDFVWAATGPALEAYSKYPVVKKADAEGVMDVGEFLGHARRMVVEFVVGRVLSPEGDEETAAALDPVTSYWLLHRQTFGTDEVPVGPVILYAVSCGLSDRELIDALDILHLKGAKGSADDDDADDDEAGGSGGGKGAQVSLKPWDKRKRKGLGETAPSGRPVPWIDRIHRTMQLWTAGDVSEVERYLVGSGIRHSRLLRRVLQAVIELSPAGSNERALLEAISNHLGVEPDAVGQLTLAMPPRATP